MWKSRIYSVMPYYNYTLVCYLCVLDILIFLYIFVFASSLTIVALVVALNHLNLSILNKNPLNLTHYSDCHVSIVGYH